MKNSNKKKKRRKIWAGWINILAFIIPIHWLGFLIAGLVVKKLKSEFAKKSSD